MPSTPTVFNLTDTVFNNAYINCTKQTNHLVTVAVYNNSLLANTIYLDSNMLQLDYVLPWQQPLRVLKSQLETIPWQNNLLFLPNTVANNLFKTGFASLNYQQKQVFLTTTGFKNQAIYINDTLLYLPSLSVKGSDSLLYTCVLSKNLPILFKNDSNKSSIKIINQGYTKKLLQKRKSVELNSMDTLNYTITTATEANMELRVLYNDTDSFGTSYTVEGQTFEPIYNFKNEINSKYNQIKNPIFDAFVPSLNLTQLFNEPQCFFIDSQTVKNWLLKTNDSFMVQSVDEQNPDIINNKTVLFKEYIGQFNDFVELVKVKHTLSNYGIVKFSNKKQTIGIELLKTKQGYVLYSLQNKDMFYTIKLLSIH